MNPVLVVHGGAVRIVDKDQKEPVRQGIIRAATVGYNILREGGSAVDAVESAVTVLEDDPEFNAGFGSVLNTDGEVEMDASIMNGKDLSAGAVSAVRCVANPIKLARLVMEKTPHCFLTDQGAAKFAAAMGIPEVPGKQLVTERNIKLLEKEKHEKDAQKLDCQKSRRHCPIEMREPRRQSAVFQSPHLKKINRLLKMSISQDFDRKRTLKRNSQKKKKAERKKEAKNLQRNGLLSFLKTKQ
uniref:Uncharacterized protein n=1 Tax=Equus asinus TaxID=9793 RepID=A0A9L0KE83_EQUAS